MSEFSTTAKVGDPVVFEVIRKDKKGNNQTLKLKGKVKKVKRVIKNTIDIDENMSEEQKFLLKKWLTNE